MAWLKAALIVAGFFLTLTAISWGWGWAGCTWYGYQTERAVKYSGTIGCMVKASGGWVPRTEIRTTLD